MTENISTKESEAIKAGDTDTLDILLRNKGIMPGTLAYDVPMAEANFTAAYKYNSKRDAYTIPNWDTTYLVKVCIKEIATLAAELNLKNLTVSFEDGKLSRIDIDRS